MIIPTRYAQGMSLAQIVAVTTNEIGPTGPTRRIYAVGLPGPAEALSEISKRLKPGETATWLDQRTLAVSPGEVRPI